MCQSLTSLECGLLMTCAAASHRRIATIERPERAPPPRRRFTFLPRNLVNCGICYAKVCLSVRPSVTPVSHALTIQDIKICFAPHDRGAFLVSGDQICNTVFRACGRNDCIKERHPLVTAKIGPLIHHISETCKIGRNLLLFTCRNLKLHTCFPLVPKLVTLNGVMAVILRYFAEFVLYRAPILRKSWLHLCFLHYIS